MKTLYNDINVLKANGYKGGVSVASLKNSCASLPDESGIYVITKPLEQHASFLAIGTGGYFKDKNPNVSISELQSNWVNDTIVVYIGKATSLKKRLGQYMKFGTGKKIGHWGGRFIWQLSYADQLLVWWKSVANPRDMEKEMIQEFKQEYGVRPFANLQN